MMQNWNESQKTLDVASLLGEYPGALLIFRMNENKEILFASRDTIRLFACEDWEDFLKYSEGSLRGLISQEDYPLVESQVHVHMGSENQRADRNMGLEETIHYHIVTKSGRICAVEQSGKYVQTSAYGDLFFASLEEDRRRNRHAFEKFFHEGEAEASGANAYDFKSYIIWNLTKNTSYIVQEGFNYVPEEKLGQYSYDDHYQHMLKRMENTKYLDTVKTYTRDYLLNEFAQGRSIRPLVINYHVQGEWACVHTSFDMIRDPDTEDVYLRIQNQNAIQTDVYEKVLSMEYVTITELDMQSDVIVAYRLHKDTPQVMMDALANGSYDVVREAMIESVVAEEYRDTFRTLTEKAYLDEKLQTVNTYSFVFRNTADTYTELKVARTDSDVAGAPKRVLIGYADKDQATREQMAAEAERERYYELTEAFSEEYQSVFYVEPENDLAIPMRVYDQNMKGNLQPASYKEIYGAAIGSVVAPSDREQMMLTGKPEYMREALAHRQSFTVFYQTLIEGRMTFCEKKTIKLDPIDEPPTRLIVGYAERELEIGHRYVAQQLTAEYDIIGYWSLPEDNVRMFTKDEQGEVHSSQNRYSEVFQELRAKVDEEYLAVFDQLQSPDSISHSLQGLERIEFNCRVRDNVKPWRRIVARAVTRDENQQLRSVIVSFRGLTDTEAEKLELSEKIAAQNAELKQAKTAAEAANAAKTAFLFNMSHDIRTPMNAIMGFRDLLEKNQEDAEKRAYYLHQIEESSSVLLSIINNVLEMARIEKGTIEVDEIAWSAEQFNDTVYSVFQGLMNNKGLEFTRSIQVEHHYVLCDPTKLREVFLNILSNAYKYTQAGGKVHMDLVELPSEREGYAVYQTTITDTGIGMSQEFLPHIFEEFAREQTSTVSKIEGTGLGMPIVKRLVEFMNGTIEVYSEQGRGSKFVVTLPHKITDRSSLTNFSGVEIDPNLFRGKRILLAEDIAVNAEIANAILSEAGFIVDIVPDGAKCVEKLSKSEEGYYDLILMDIQMPVMNGYEATRAIRQMENNKKGSIPIIAMTANAFEEDKREALRAGMNGHISKPINVKQMMSTLAQIL